VITLEIWIFTSLLLITFCLGGIATACWILWYSKKRTKR
jgi:hypothetical protein